MELHTFFQLCWPRKWLMCKNKDSTTRTIVYSTISVNDLDTILGYRAQNVNGTYSIYLALTFDF